jgi:hypothetical protein
MCTAHFLGVLKKNSHQKFFTPLPLSFYFLVKCKASVGGGEGGARRRLSPKEETAISNLEVSCFRLQRYNT